MPARYSVTSILALLALLLLVGTVRRGPLAACFSVGLPAPRTPPQSGGCTAEPGRGSPSSEHSDHVVEGGGKQVVATHGILLPRSGCGCPPGTETPVTTSDLRALLARLEILEELVKMLKDQCSGSCPGAAQAGISKQGTTERGTGPTDARSLCSLHGRYDLSLGTCSCEPGWTGPTCSHPTDARVLHSNVGHGSKESGVRSCPAGCHGRGYCERGFCTCWPGYTGRDCGTRTCPADCHGRGRCMDGRCLCHPGFTGDDCSSRQCPGDCRGHGHCQDGTCLCDPGYEGEDCSVRSCPVGCHGRGHCERGFCTCWPGYTGRDCGTRACPADCHGHGRCMDGRCLCHPGFTGDDCSSRQCPGDCRGHGHCQDGTCLCDPGYEGEDCSVLSCPAGCQGRGQCERGRCVCWPGSTGRDCGIRTCLANCQGHGQCMDGQCLCHPGFTGDDCSSRQCPGDCRGHGRCEDGRCACASGYEGEDCGSRQCPGDCRGHGRCEDGMCICASGYEGEDCSSHQCPGDCHGHGRCEDGTCICASGYEGEDCGVRTCPAGCRGRGQCLHGHCTCDDGYSGNDCGMRRCPRDCSMRGVCQDGVCTCWEGYTGEDCGLRICPAYYQLQMTSMTQGSVGLSRTAPEGQFDHILVHDKDGSGQPKAVQGMGHEDRVTMSGLQSHGKHNILSSFRDDQSEGLMSAIKVTAAEEDTQSPTVVEETPRPSDPSTQTPESPKEPILEELTVTGSSPGSLSLSWVVPQGHFDSFAIQHEDTDGQLQVVPVAADQREVTISGLMPNRKYTFLLYGLIGWKQLGPISADGTTAPLEKEVQPPPRLGELRVTDETPDSVRLVWKVSQGPFDNFVVQFWDKDGQPQALPVSGNQNEVLVSSLKPSTHYTFFLFGLHEGKHQGPVSAEGTTGSAPAAAKSPGDPEALLSQVSVSNLTSSSLRVSWEAPPSAFDSFLLHFEVPSPSTLEPQLQQELPVPGTQRSAVLQDLRPGTLYTLTLYGLRGPHRAIGIPGTVRTLSPVLESPRDLQFRAIGNTSAKVSWMPPPSNVDSFIVSYRLTDGGEPQSVQVDGRAQTQELKGLVPGAQYSKVTVVSVRGSEESEPLTGLLTTELESPRDLEAKEAPSCTALLAWMEPQVSAADYRHLRAYDSPGEKAQETLLAGEVTSHQLLGLFPHSSYRAQLWAMWGKSLKPSMAASLTTGGLRTPFPRDCGEEMQNGASTSGTTTIFLNGHRERPLTVFCDMETDGGGWLVFQRRMDGHTDFWRDWEDYAHGFGDISREFWLGNEALHSLTKAGDYTLRVDLRARNAAAFAQYEVFQVDSAAEHYRLHVEGYHGTAGDSMSYHSGSVFSTRDRDPNDLLIRCAVSYRGAWWYRNCHYANLNGLYGSMDDQGVSWYHWKGFHFSIPSVEMKIRPRSYQAPA